MIVPRIMCGVGLENVFLHFALRAVPPHIYSFWPSASKPAIGLISNSAFASLTGFTHTDFFFVMLHRNHFDPSPLIAPCAGDSETCLIYVIRLVIDYAIGLSVMQIMVKDATFADNTWCRHIPCPLDTHIAVLNPKRWLAMRVINV